MIFIKLNFVIFFLYKIKKGSIVFHENQRPKKLIEHTEKVLGPEAEMIFQYGGKEAKQFDFGEKGRKGYMVSCSPYETMEHVDGWGRFILSIKDIPFPDAGDDNI